MWWVLSDSYANLSIPFFSAFGPEPVRARLSIGRARVLITTELLYRRKIEPIRSRLPELEYVLITGDAARATDLTAWEGLARITERRSSSVRATRSSCPQSPSGSIGRPSWHS